MDTKTAPNQDDFENEEDFFKACRISRGTKTAETPNAQQILFAKIIKASEDAGNNISDTQDDLDEIANDPAHLIVIDSMREYADQVSSPLKKRIDELEAWINIEDQLPEISVSQVDDKNGILHKVIAYTTTLGITTAYYWGTDVYGPMKGWSLMGVTHWKELPKHPSTNGKQD